MIIRKKATADVLEFLRKQDDLFFAKRRKTREQYINDDEIIRDTVNMYLTNVNEYGMTDLEKACKIACECFREDTRVYIGATTVEDAVGEIVAAHRSLEVRMDINDFLDDVVLDSLTIKQVVAVYASF